MSLLKSPVFKVALPFLAIFLVLRIGFWLHAFPNPDEAYYWLWGQHPDFSYYDHPPLLAWVQGLFTMLLGKSFLVLRLPNLISTIAFFYTYHHISRYLYGKDSNDYFWVTVLLILASPLYFLFMALAWHDHLLITFSLISAYWFIRFLDSYTTHAPSPDWGGNRANQQGESRWLYGSAIMLGLAFLCKYNAVFIGLGLIATVITQKQFRPLWRDRRLYQAITITAAFLLPIVFWNVNNHFQSFQYYASRSVDSGAFRLKFSELPVFLLVSCLTLAPVNVWAIWRVICQPDSRISHSSYRIVSIWIFSISTFSLIAISFISTAIYYWNILAYILLFPLLPMVFLRQSPDLSEDLSAAPRLIYKRRLLAGQFYGLLFAGLLVIHYSVIPLSAWFGPEGDPDSRMLYGWDSVGIAVQQQAATLKNPVLITTDYRSASALAYQLNQRDAIAVSERIDQFDFWHNTDRLTSKDAVILGDDWYPISPQLLAQFERTSPPVTVPVQQFGVWIKNYYLIKGYGYQPAPDNSSPGN